MNGANDLDIMKLIVKRLIVLNATIRIHSSGHAAPKNFLVTKEGVIATLTMNVLRACFVAVTTA